MVFLWASVCAGVNQFSDNSSFDFAISILVLAGIPGAVMGAYALGRLRARVMARAIDGGTSHMYKSPYHVEYAVRTILALGNALETRGIVPKDDSGRKARKRLLRFGNGGNKVAPMPSSSGALSLKAPLGASLGGGGGPPTQVIVAGMDASQAQALSLTQRSTALGGTLGTTVGASNALAAASAVAGVPNSDGTAYLLSREQLEQATKLRQREEEKAMRAVAVRRAAEVFKRASVESFPESALLDMFHANFLHCYPEAVDLVDYVGFWGYRLDEAGQFTGEPVTAADLESFIIEEGLSKTPALDIHFMLMQAKQTLRQEISSVLNDAKSDVLSEQAVATIAASIGSAGGMSGDRGIVENVSFERLMRECTTATLSIQAAELKLWAELSLHNPDSLAIYRQIMVIAQMQARADSRYVDWMRMAPSDPIVLQSYAMYLLQIKRDTAAAEKVYKDVAGILHTSEANAAARGLPMSAMFSSMTAAPSAEDPRAQRTQSQPDGSQDAHGVSSAHDSTPSMTVPQGGERGDPSSSALVNPTIDPTTHRTVSVTGSFLQLASFAGAATQQALETAPNASSHVASLPSAIATQSMSHHNVHQHNSHNQPHHHHNHHGRRGARGSEDDSKRQAAQEVGNAIDVTAVGGVIGAMMRRATKLSATLRAVINSGQSLKTQSFASKARPAGDWGNLIMAALAQKRMREEQLREERSRRMHELRRAAQGFQNKREPAVTLLVRTLLVFIGITCVLFWTGVGVCSTLSKKYTRSIEDLALASDLYVRNERLHRSVWQSALLAADVIPDTVHESYSGIMATMRYQGANMSVLNRQLYKGGASSSMLDAERTIYDTDVMEVMTLSKDGALSSMGLSLSEAVTDLASHSLTLSRSPPQKANFSVFSADAFFMAHNGDRGIRDTMNSSIALMTQRAHLELTLVELLAWIVTVVCCGVIVLPFVLLMVPSVVRVQLNEYRMLDVFGAVPSKVLFGLRKEIVKNIQSLRHELSTEGEYVALLSSVGIDHKELGESLDDAKENAVVDFAEDISAESWRSRRKIKGKCRLSLYLIGEFSFPVLLVCTFIIGAFLHAFFILHEADGHSILASNLALLRSGIYRPATSARSFFAQAHTPAASLHPSGESFIFNSHGCDREQLQSLLSQHDAWGTEVTDRLRLIIDGTKGASSSAEDIKPLATLQVPELKQIFFGDACSISSKAGIVSVRPPPNATTIEPLTTFSGASPVFCASANPASTGSYKSLAALGLVSAISTHMQRARAMFALRLAENRTGACSPIDFAEPGELWSLDSSLFHFLEPVSRYALSLSIEAFNSHLNSYRTGQALFAFFLGFLCFLLYVFFIKGRFDSHAKITRFLMFSLPPGSVETEPFARALAGADFVPLQTSEFHRNA
jgi:hypothetical protein